MPKGECARSIAERPSQLLGAQRDQRIDPGRAPGWSDTGNQDDEALERRDGEIGARIEHVDADECDSRQAGDCCRQASDLVQAQRLTEVRDRACGARNRSPITTEGTPSTPRPASARPINGRTSTIAK
jgi:hypothetical protein